MGGRGWKALVVVGVWAVAACSGSERVGTISLGITESGVTPVVVEGNPTCPAGYSEFKIDPPNAGVYEAADGFAVEIGYNENGTLWFDANQGVDIVFAKGGPNANEYIYDPEVSEDSGLITPTNPSNGKPYGWSHVTFCYDEDEVVPLEVSKTANATQGTTWTWDIDKVGACERLTPGAAPGAWLGAFRVTVSATSALGEWTTTGEITIHNPNSVDAEIAAVVDELDGAAIDVDCGVTFPYTLGPDATLTCSYTATSATEPVLNTVEVTTTGLNEIEGGTAEATVVTAAGDETDECVTVYDAWDGGEPMVLGNVCASDLNAEGWYRFEYSHEITWQTCDPFEVSNIASFETNDTATTGEDEFITPIQPLCGQPCPTDPALNALCVAQQQAALLGLNQCTFAD